MLSMVHLARIIHEPPAPTADLAVLTLPNMGRRRGQGGLRRKAHPEHLPSVADGKVPGLSTTTPPESPDLALHYQWRDYAPLQSRPPCRPGVLGSRTVRRTEQVRLRSKSRGAAGWLPGGTAISTISLRRLVDKAG